jgi:hypothetical protein
MEVPTSAILAETFIRYLEHTKIVKILNEYHIIDHHRYVDNILIIYNTHTTNIKNTLMEFNAVHQKIKFTIKKETCNKLNYPEDKHSQLTFGIHQKPTTTDLIIHNNSCHAYEHKKSAINYLINRMNTYQLLIEMRTKD